MSSDEENNNDNDNKNNNILHVDLHNHPLPNVESRTSVATASTESHRIVRPKVWNKKKASPQVRSAVLAALEILGQFHHDTTISEEDEEEDASSAHSPTTVGGRISPGRSSGRSSPFRSYSPGLLGRQPIPNGLPSPEELHDQMWNDLAGMGDKAVIGRASRNLKVYGQKSPRMRKPVAVRLDEGGGSSNNVEVDQRHLFSLSGVVGRSMTNESSNNSNKEANNLSPFYSPRNGRRAGTTTIAAEAASTAMMERK